MLLGLVRAPLYAPALAAALPLALHRGSRGAASKPLVGLSSATAGGRCSADLRRACISRSSAPRTVPRLAQAADAAGVDFGDAFARPVPADLRRLAARRRAGCVLHAAGGAGRLAGAVRRRLDPVTPPRHGERVARALGAKARHVVVPQAGHGVMALRLHARRAVPLHRRRHRRRSAEGGRRLRAGDSAAAGLRAACMPEAAR